ALDTLAVQRLRAVARAQEQIVGGFLNLDEVRHLEDFADLAEIAADTFLANVDLRHALRNLSFSPAGFRRATEARRLGGEGRPVPYLPPVPSGGSRTCRRTRKDAFAESPYQDATWLGTESSVPSRKSAPRESPQHPITSARPWRQPLRASSSSSRRRLSTRLPSPCRQLRPGSWPRPDPGR